MPGSNGTSCDQTSGRCTCKTGFDGVQCATCKDGMFGERCSKSCGCNSAGRVGTSCDQTSGQCNCMANFMGLQCDTCVDGMFGDECSKVCPCNTPEKWACERYSGACDRCAAGLAGGDCSLPCTCLQPFECDGSASASNSTGQCTSCQSNATTAHSNRKGPNCELLTDNSPVASILNLTCPVLLTSHAQSLFRLAADNIEVYINSLTIEPHCNV